MANTGLSSKERFYRCIALQRRRDVLAYLREASDGVATLDELVDHLVATEGEEAPDRDTVACSLYHVHLPLLDDDGAIEFDQRSRTARYSENPTLERLLAERQSIDAS